MSPIYFVPIAVAILVIVYVWATAFQTIRISRWEQGGLYIDDGFDRMLPPGQHSILKWGRRIHVSRVPTHVQYQPVGPVEALTADSLPVRLSATVVFKVTDAEVYLAAPVYPALQLAVSQALMTLAGELTLEALLKRDVGHDARLLAVLSGPPGSVTVEEVVLGAVVMPPELRRLLTEAERARMEGLAALERARGEHAALRSLANAARLLKDNPDLMNLRLLQALGTGGKGATLVLGDGALARPGNGRV